MCGWYWNTLKDFQLAFINEASSLVGNHANQQSIKNTTKTALSLGMWSSTSTSPSLESPSLGKSGVGLVGGLSSTGSSSTCSKHNFILQPRGSKIKQLVDSLLEHRPHQHLFMNREWNIIQEEEDENISYVLALESDLNFMPCHNLDIVSEKFVLKMHYESFDPSSTKSKHDFEVFEVAFTVGEIRFHKKNIRIALVYKVENFTSIPYRLFSVFNSIFTQLQTKLDIEYCMLIDDRNSAFAEACGMIPSKHNLNIISLLNGLNVQQKQKFNPRSVTNFQSYKNLMENIYSGCKLVDLEGLFFNEKYLGCFIEDNFGVCFQVWNCENFLVVFNITNCNSCDIALSAEQFDCINQILAEKFNDYLNIMLVHSEESLQVECNCKKLTFFIRDNQKVIGNHGYQYQTKKNDHGFWNLIFGGASKSPPNNNRESIMDSFHMNLFIDPRDFKLWISHKWSEDQDLNFNNSYTMSDLRRESRL